MIKRLSESFFYVSAKKYLFLQYFQNFNKKVFLCHLISAAF